jgi:hypothetical protein
MRDLLHLEAILLSEVAGLKEVWKVMGRPVVSAAAAAAAMVHRKSPLVVLEV